MKKVFCLLLLAALPLGAAEKLRVSFARGKWDPELFQYVKNPRVEMKGEIVPRDDHIANKVPEHLDGEELRSCEDAYCALLTKKKFGGKLLVIAAKMSFDHTMAPGIIIAPELGKSADGRHPELRGHYEVILWRRGITIWDYRYADGKMSWRKLAYVMGDFKPKTVYDLVVIIDHVHSSRLIVKCGGMEFGCAIPAELAEQDFFVGPVACEGLNRFYEFRVRK